VRIGSSDGMSMWPSLLISIATAMLLGLGVHFLVFRPLRHAPALAKVAASIGLMLTLQSIVSYRFGTETVSVKSFLPKGAAFTYQGVRFPADRLIIGGIAVAVAIGLWALYRFTMFGLATRAAAENERGAMSLGYSPELQAGLNWMLATVLAGLGGILVAPLTNLTPTGSTLLIIPALAAGLIARFTSFGVTVTAALLIGVFQNVLANVAGRFSFLPDVGTPDALPFVVIIAVMFIVGKSLPSRGSAVEGRLQAVPMSRRRVVRPVVLVGGTILALYVVSASYRLALINTMIGAIVCLSLVVITGFIAQISLFQATLAGVAAYSLAGLTTGMGVPFPISPLLASLGATVVGLIAALPALRVRGIHLAVITLAGGFAIQQLIFNNPDFTGGFEGATVPAPHFFGTLLSFSKGKTIAQPIFGVFVLVVLTLVAFAVSNLRRSATGRRLLSVRTNERAAASMGVNTARMKFVAFGISSFIAGLAGCLISYQQTHISASSFSALVSVSFLALAFLGGITSVSGAIVGGLLWTGGLMTLLLDDLIFSRSSNGLALQDLIGGIGLILTAILNPEGIAGAVRQTVDHVKAKFARGGPPTDAPGELQPMLAAGGGR